MGKKYTYDELLELYNARQLEISELKNRITALETKSEQKRNVKPGKIIFDDVVKRFVNLLPHVVYQANTEGDFLFLNQFALNSFGYTEGDFKKGMNIRQVLGREDDFSKIISGKKNKLKTEELMGEAYTLKKKNGDLFYGLIYATAHLSDDHIPVIFGIIIDHTEYQKVYDTLLITQKELKELNVAKDKLFSIIAHDLKNPFNAISGFSELILSGIDEYSIEQIESYIKIIHKSSSKGYSLLENLLEWTRSQTGKLKMKKESLKVAELVQENIDFLNEKALAKSIKLWADCSNLLFVNADKNMLSTILRNLVTNALKFTQQGGTIKITAKKIENRELASFVQIAVVDSGIGIQKVVLDKLFKLDESYSTQGTDFEQGTGLGLILCKDFVEKSGGEIWAESEYGKGSTFYFTLPEQCQ